MTIATATARIAIVTTATATAARTGVTTGVTEVVIRRVRSGRSCVGRFLCAPAGLAPAGAFAHSFSAPYVLPVPLTLYVYACAAMLVASFVLLGLFMVRTRAADVGTRPLLPAGTSSDASGGVLAVLRALALGCLIFTIAVGLFGTRDPAGNLAMTLFWVFFLLGFAYLTVLVGNVYALVNPWETLLVLAEKLGFDTSRPRVAYPELLGDYPAFVFYVALIWLEIFVLPRPGTLAAALLVYTLLTLGGAWVFGRAAWLRHGELFAVYFKLIATLAPLDYTRNGRGLRSRLRRPLVGALEDRPGHLGLVLFVFFMLSSTTYDAIHGTYLWQSLYWKHLLALLQPLWGGDMVRAQEGLMNGYEAYQRLGLLVAPFLYLAIFIAILAATKAITRSTLSIRTLALEFAYSLIPIALVYNATHYYTFVAAQFAKIPWFATDPLGLGWDLLGIGPQTQEAPLNMAVIWHVQVALILIGHVASVYLAHAVALRVFPTRRQAILSQIPLLLLMVAYTGIGLWVLSLATIPPGTGSG